MRAGEIRSRGNHADGAKFRMMITVSAGDDDFVAVLAERQRVDRSILRKG